MVIEVKVMNIRNQRKRNQNKHTLNRELKAIELAL